MLTPGRSCLAFFMAAAALCRAGTVLLMAALAEEVRFLLVDGDLGGRRGRMTTLAGMADGMLLVIKDHRAVGGFVAHCLGRGGEGGRRWCWCWFCFDSNRCSGFLRLDLSVCDYSRHRGRGHCRQGACRNLSRSCRGGRVYLCHCRRRSHIDSIICWCCHDRQRWLHGSRLLAAASQQNDGHYGGQREGALHDLTPVWEGWVSISSSWPVLEGSSRDDGHR